MDNSKIYLLVRNSSLSERLLNLVYSLCSLSRFVFHPMVYVIMVSMKFVDELTVEVQAGKGGNGMISFRREKFVPFGGPSGGDGGHGGDVVLVASSNVNTLYELSFNRTYRSEDGENGMAKDMTGATGSECIIEVPVGTLVYDLASEVLLADLNVSGARFCAAKGGRGGHGNSRFASSVRRAPRVAEKGELGERRKLRLELKLLADVGIVGLPNAGKSTLLSVSTHAKPKIADYPFTTLVPMLGIVKLEDAPSFCIADIPGLIKDAHVGVGLGTHFLKHIERTRILLILIDLSDTPKDSCMEPLEILLNELNSFDPKLLQKPILVCANKLDLPDGANLWPEFKTLVEKRGFPVLPLSCATSKGKLQLIQQLAKMLAMRPKEPMTESERSLTTAERNSPEKLYTYLAPFEIEETSPNNWRVSGREIEKLVQVTDFTNDESIVLFKRKLKKLGFIEELSRCNGMEDDCVTIGDYEFSYREFFI
ncbi:GTPase ObgE [bacterium]|nr:GTPase ObgE [bacterium]